MFIKTKNNLKKILINNPSLIININSKVYQHFKISINENDFLYNNLSEIDGSINTNTNDESVINGCIRINVPWVRK